MRRLAMILPGRLYMGPRTHTLDDQECRDLVARYALTAVINLWHTPDGRMERLMAGEYVHRSLPDGKRLDEVALAALVEGVLQRLRQGHCILVHCYGGRNRAGLLCALVVRRWLGLTGEAALRLVQRARTSALKNSSFAAYVRALPRAEPSSNARTNNEGGSPP